VDRIHDACVQRGAVQVTAAFEYQRRNAPVHQRAQGGVEIVPRQEEEVTTERGGTPGAEQRGQVLPGVAAVVAAQVVPPSPAQPVQQEIGLHRIHRIRHRHVGEDGHARMPSPSIVCSHTRRRESRRSVSTGLGM